MSTAHPSSQGLMIYAEQEGRKIVKDRGDGWLPQTAGQIPIWTYGDCDRHAQDIH